MGRFVIIIELCCLLPLSAIFTLPVDVWSATYSIPPTITTVDGGSYCGGKPCKGGDKLILQGGSRKGLLLKNFNGNGSYITVTNENVNPDRPVVLDQGPGGGYAILSISNCKWLDIKGNGDPDLEYGINVNNGAVSRSAAIHVYGKSEHVKVGYTEVSFNGNTSNAGSGIRVQDSSLTPSWIFNDIEIHHNFIHDTKYAGMYLGHNQPPNNDAPYIANFSVHHNIMKNMGSYGITLKGVMGPGASLIYDNVVDTTGVNSYYDYKGDTFKQGIGSVYHYKGAIVKIYNNTVMYTEGPGIRLGDTYTTGTHEVYGNLVLGCGTGNDEILDHGIITTYNVRAIIRDNKIIQPVRYGIFVKGSSVNVVVNNNLVGDAGLGAIHSQYANDALKEGQSSLANTYYANVKDFNFSAWTDDKNYYNDIFTFDGKTNESQILAPKDLKIESN